MKPFLRSFQKRQSGATAIEYVMIAAAVVIACAATIYLIGDDIHTMLPHALHP